MMQTVLTETATEVYSSVPVSLELLSSTKDSIRVKWSLEETSLRGSLEGFKLKYIAEGSRVVQHTPTITPHQTDYDIVHLHEDTEYSICLEMYPDLDKHYLDKECIMATTSTDSLTVALGSTFGAFLTLGIIILCVFIAKWQHTQRVKKRMSVSEQTAKPYDCEAHFEDLELETSGLSMQVNEDTIKFSEIESVGSRTSLSETEEDTTMANGITIAAAASLQTCSEFSDQLGSNHQTNSFECCASTHDRCHGNCRTRVVEYEPSNPQVNRYKQGYLIRQKSIESPQSSTKLGTFHQQYSLDSYDSSPRSSLPRQYSQDSSRCSSCSHTQLLIKQKSQDSAYQYQKYLAPTADGTYTDTDYHCMDDTTNCRRSPEWTSHKRYSSNSSNTSSSPAGSQTITTNFKHLQQQHGNNNRNLSNHNETRPPDVRPKDRTNNYNNKSLNTGDLTEGNTVSPSANDSHNNAQTNSSQSTYLTSSQQAQAESKERNGQLIGTLRTNNSCPSW